MVKCLPEFEYFTVFLKNKNIIFKIRRSKVTDYAALKEVKTMDMILGKCKFPSFFTVTCCRYTLELPL